MNHMICDHVVIIEKGKKHGLNRLCNNNNNNNNNNNRLKLSQYMVLWTHISAHVFPLDGKLDF